MYLGQLEGGDPMSVCACSGLHNIPLGGILHVTRRQAAQYWSNLNRIVGRKIAITITVGLQAKPN